MLLKTMTALCACRKILNSIKRLEFAESVELPCLSARHSGVAILRSKEHG